MYLSPTEQQRPDSHRIDVVTDCGERQYGYGVGKGRQAGKGAVGSGSVRCNERNPQVTTMAMQCEVSISKLCSSTQHMSYMNREIDRLEAVCGCNQIQMSAKERDYI